MLTAFRFHRFILLAVVLTLLVVPVWGVCVPDTLRVTYVRGFVKARLEGRDESFEGAVVKIFTERNPRKLVAQKETTADGSFDFGNLKSGKYRLVVSYPKLWDFELDLVVKQKGASKNDQLTIWLGADFLKPCAGSYAELKAKPTKNE